MPALKRSITMDTRPRKKVKYPFKRMLSVPAQVNRILNRRAERKEITSTFGQSPTSATGSVNILNQIAEGSDVNQRIGRHLNMFNIEGTVSIQQLASGTADSGWFALVLDRQSDGAVASFATIFDGSTGAVTGLQFKNTLQNDKRFKVLWMQDWMLNPGNNTNPFYRRYLRFAAVDSEVEYGTAAVATPTSGALLFCSSSTLGNGTTNGVVISANLKLKFQDI